MNIPVLPPDINESYSDFTVVKNENKKEDEHETIRFGLTTIKNFGEGIAKVIIAERKLNGKFKDLNDFLERIKDKNLNKKSLEALIKSGAMDAFGERGQLLANCEAMLAYNKEIAKAPSSQDSLFGLFGGGSKEIFRFTLQSAPEATQNERLAWEKELLGLYLSGHPLDKYRPILEKQKENIIKLKEGYTKEREVLFAAIIEEVKPIMTKKNEPMAFVRLADFTGTIESVVFPRTYQQYKNVLVVDKCLAIVGKVNKRNDEVSVLIDKVKVLN
jgi:DNA polymerase-3 subunit alpha